MFVLMTVITLKQQRKTESDIQQMLKMSSFALVKTVGATENNVCVCLFDISIRQHSIIVCLPVSVPRQTVGRAGTLGIS